jgi:23S rRNA (adenine2503-C2)-methyltransferase
LSIADQWHGGGMLLENSGWMKVELIGMELEQLGQLMARLGQRPYRARQLHDAIYCRRAADFSSMTDLPKDLRARLEQMALITSARLRKAFVSSDGTRRFLLELADGCQIETVFIPEARRDTICISSQVGCPLACSFCVTGVLGLKRNMTAGEIASQVYLALNEVYGAGGRPNHGINIVLMGMGEPLLNYDNVMRAIRVFANGFGISPRRITLSTAGIVPRIYDLAREPLRPKLAISLAATNDELRDRLLPINRRYPLSELIEACRRYPLRGRERLTFEYVMLDQINDGDQDARRLARLISGMRVKVNLIPHNPAPEIPHKSSPIERIEAFQRILIGAGIPAFIRRPRGQDISAACGQLAARHQAAPMP